ncbi:MAG: SHOCT domain-containing protein [Salinigranum sp.]
MSILTGEEEGDEGRERGRDRERRRHRERERDRNRTAADDREGADEPDALATLRDRYARGELSDEQFEAKLEALLETETPEGARERLERERERAGDR